MKKFLLIIPIVFTLSYAVYHQYKGSMNTGMDKLHNKMAPSDHLYLQRSYPDDKLNVKAMDKVRKEVHQQIKASKNQKVLNNTAWDQEGPTNLGGRINCLAVHPSDDDHILSGTAAGGIYRTTDGGNSWEPIGEEMGELSISSIVFDENNPDILFAGTGDHNIGGSVNVGDGIYKSIDGGETWENKGLVDQRIVSKIIIDPTNSQIIYAATMGLPFERNDERGLYKSVDGGETWVQSLFVSNESGIIDMVMNPSNPNQLYACSWTRIRNNSESVISGTDGHIFRTNDGGDTWEIVDGGLPMENGVSVSRIGLAMSQENPGKVFCIVINPQGFGIMGIYRLESDAVEWEALGINGLDTDLGGFGWYFAQIRVNPFNDDEISILGVELQTTYNGGDSWQQTTPDWITYEVHADKHDMVYLNANEVLLATDGGLYKSNGFSNWQDIDEIPNSQIYRVAVHPLDNTYTAGLQDNGTTTGNGAFPFLWSRDYGGDGFQPIYSPDDPSVFFAETQNGNIFSLTDNGWMFFNGGIDGSDRRNWDMPIIMSVHNSDVMYTGTYRLYKNTNTNFDAWTVISPSLTGDVIESSRFHTITTIAESRIDPEVLYTGSVDAKVYRTIDGGENWDEIGLELPQLYVTDIKTSPTTAGIVYVSHSGYKDNNNVSHIHISYDFGNTWNDISGDLPDLPVNHMEIIDDEQIVIATDFGVYFTANGGVNWDRVGNNMPSIPVFDLAIDEDNDKLIAGTFARSMMSFPLSSLSTVIGVEEVIKESTVDVFPNPTVDVIRITSESNIQSYRLLDNQGKLSASMDQINRQQVEIDLTNFSSGIYIVSIIDDMGNATSKKVIKK